MRGRVTRVEPRSFADELEDAGMRLEAEAAERARKNAEDQERAIQRRAEMLRAFYTDGLEGEAKLRALEEDRLRISDRLAIANDNDKAALEAQADDLKARVAKLTTVSVSVSKVVSGVVQAGKLAVKYLA